MNGPLAHGASLPDVWVDGGLHVTLGHASGWVKVLEWLTEAEHLVLLFLVDGHRSCLHIASGHDLSSNKGVHTSFAVPQANLLDRVNPQVLQALNLRGSDLLPRVNCEVSVVNDHLVVEFVDFLLLSLLFFLLGVISHASEDSLEIIWL